MLLPDEVRLAERAVGRAILRVELEGAAGRRDGGLAERFVGVLQVHRELIVVGIQRGDQRRAIGRGERRCPIEAPQCFRQLLPAAAQHMLPPPLALEPGRHGLRPCAAACVQPQVHHCNDRIDNVRFQGQELVERAVVLFAPNQLAGRAVGEPRGQTKGISPPLQVTGEQMPYAEGRGQPRCGPAPRPPGQRPCPVT